MTAAQPRLALTRRSWTILVLGIAAVTALTVLVTRAETRRAWERLEEPARRYLAEFEATDFNREAAWGETVEGAGFPHLKAAMEAAERLRRAHRGELERIAIALDAGLAPEPADLAALEGPADEALAHLRSAARCRDARIPPRTRNGYEVGTVHSADFGALAHLALARLMAAASPGDQLDAVRTVLDVQQAARDVLVTPSGALEPVGLIYASHTWLAPALQAGMLDRMSETSRREWLSGLRRIEASIPKAPTAQPTTMPWVAGFLLVDGGDADSPGLRMALVRELEVTPHDIAKTEAALSRIRPAFESALTSGSGPVLPEVERIEASLGIDEDVMHSLTHPLPTVAGLWLSARAGIAFLRHGLELHLGESTPVGADPFGTGVIVTRKGGRITISTERQPGGSVVEVTL